jgi:hypothetical protein
MKNMDVYTIKKIEKIDYEKPIVNLYSVSYYCYRATVTDIFGNTKNLDFESLTEIDKWLEEETLSFYFIELLKMLKLKENGDAFFIVKRDGILKVYEYDTANGKVGFVLLILDISHLKGYVVEDLKDGNTIIKLDYDGKVKECKLLGE